MNFLWVDFLECLIIAPLSYLHAELQSNQGNQGESGNFIFYQGLSGENKRFFRKGGKIRDQVSNFVIPQQRLSPYPAMHPIQSDSCQILRFLW